MIAVADTSPICYLILIGEIDLLPKLFSRVLVRPAGHWDPGCSGRGCHSGAA
jgi:predicted nucleic acid-binding protein